MAELPMMRGSAGGWLLQKVGSVVAVHLLSSVMIVVFVAAAMVVGEAMGGCGRGFAAPWLPPGWGKTFFCMFYDQNR